MQVFRIVLVNFLKPSMYECKTPTRNGHLGARLVGRRLGFHLYIEHVIVTEGWAHSAIHERLKGTEVVHHSFLFLSLGSEKEGPKLLKLETNRKHKSFQWKNCFTEWKNYFHFYNSNIPLKVDTEELISGQECLHHQTRRKMSLCGEERTGAGETIWELGAQELGVKGPAPQILAICQEWVTSSLIPGTSSWKMGKTAAQRMKKEGPDVTAPKMFCFFKFKLNSF